jgi:nitrate/nitrite-specific signal transduction histidine kinase
MSFTQKFAHQPRALIVAEMAATLGLRIMRYRAQSIGGDVTVERRNGPGTTVSCTVRTNSQCNEIPAA